MSYESYLFNCGSQAILEDIWKGKVTSSEVFYNSCTDRMRRVNDSKTGKELVM